MHNYMYNPFVILKANPDSTTKNIRHKKTQLILLHLYIYE